MIYVYVLCMVISTVGIGFGVASVRCGGPSSGLVLNLGLMVMWITLAVMSWS